MLIERRDLYMYLTCHCPRPFFLRLFYRMPTQKSEKTCSDGWVNLKLGCYKVMEDEMTFKEAERYCSLHDGIIAKPKRTDKMDLVKDLMEKSDVSSAWIGARQDVFGNFRWQGTRQTVKSELFADPDEEWAERCAALSREHDWKITQEVCNDRLPVVCEKRRGKVMCSGGSCYELLYKQAETFDEAVEKCARHGGYVVEINSAEEEETVVDFIDSARFRNKLHQHIWLGATDVGSESSFYWKSNNASIEYARWHEGEPNNYGAYRQAENCVILDTYQYNSWSWSDVDCSDTHDVVCERPA